MAAPVALCLNRRTLRPWITLDWPLGIPEPNFQAGGVAAELDLRSAIISTILCSGSACHTGTCSIVGFSLGFLRGQSSPW